MAAGARSPARWVGAVGGIVALVAGVTFAFLVADGAWSRGPAVGIAISVGLAPLVVGVLVERVATARKGAARAELVALWVAPLVGALAVVVPCFAFGRTTGDALVRAPGRHAWIPAFIGDGLVAWGESLGGSRPATKRGPRGTTVTITSTSSSAEISVDLSSSGTSRPPAPAADRPAPSSTEPSASRYTFGDPSYSEPECELVDASDLQSAHAAGATRATAEALASRRYPAGVAFLKAQDDAMLGAWFRGATTFEGIVRAFPTAVHEGSHVWGAKKFSPSTVSYSVRADLVIATKRLVNFDRSEILAAHVDADGDTYATTYLTGKSGAQGFNTLLDEYNAYAHSLVAAYCTRDLQPASIRTSARDGILTMMYYVETYLGLARGKHPADYDAILKDPEHRRLILTIWDRAELWLRRSEPVGSLGIASEKISGWVYAPERLDEIARLKAAPR